MSFKKSEVLKAIETQFKKDFAAGLHCMQAPPRTATRHPAWPTTRPILT